MSPRAKRIIPLILAVSAAAYLSALGNEYTYDDGPIIGRNPILADDQPWWAAWTHPYWPGSNQRDELDVLYRPLAVQTYAWERRLFGLSPLPPHVVNIVLHALVGASLWAAARRMGLGAFGSTAAALVFAAHPIHVEAVANVVGRAEILSALGLLVAMIAEQRRVDMEASHHATSPAYGLTTFVMLIASGVAMFSKESGLAAVVILPACRWRQLLVAKVAVSRDAVNRPVRWFRATLARTAVPLVILAAAYLLMRYEVCAGRLWTEGSRYGPGNLLRQAGWDVRLWTPFAVLGRYLALIAYPDRLLSDYSINVISPVRSAFEPYAMIGAAAVAAGVIATARSIRRQRLAAFLVVGFAASYFLASNTLVLIDVLLAERLFYSPSVWVCLAMGAGAQAWRGAVETDAVAPWTRRRAWLAALAGVVAMLTARTALRNPQWKDTPTLAKHDLVSMAPGQRSAHLCYLVGQFASQEGDAARAEALLREAIDLFPDYPDYYLALGESYLEAGRTREAVTALERARELAPRRADAAMTLARARQQLAGANPVESLVAARLAAKSDPSNAELCRAWADAAEAVDLAEAVDAHRRLTELDGDDPAAWNELSRVCEMAGNRAEAITAARYVLSRWPEDFAAHANLALMLMDRTDREHFDCDAAVVHARQAVGFNPAHWDLRVNLAEVLAACGRSAEAAALFEELAGRCEPGSPLRRQYEQRGAELRD
ncbi:MAG: tetratricopeptide repeat protein [Phycisphaerales bacterium]|nr:tetratricopeptide repeat protein [Phycisphaerales bacterium]